MASDDTPLMRQYKEIKEQHKDSVLFFRMGDFYEMFYDDAEEISQLLNLTLTQRQGIPMAGIPYHAVQNYLSRLLQFGKRIAICEQTESPQKAGRGISKREVVEIISPGTVLQDDFLEGSLNNYLQAFCKLGQFLGMALLDFSTGEFVATSFTATSLELCGEVLQRELLLASSRELLLMEELHDEFSSEFWSQGANPGSNAGRASRLCNRIPAWCFAPDSAERKLAEFFGVLSLKGFGFDAENQANQTDMGNGAALGAAWVVIEYLQQSQPQNERDTGERRGVLSHIQHLLPLHRKKQLQLDSAALRNLEIFQNMQNGGQDYTLFRILHQCQSAMGSRCLHRWLREPQLQKDILEQRYKNVAALLGDGLLRSGIRENLSRISDLERIMSRVTTAKANARDLVALAQSLVLYETIYDRLEHSPSADNFRNLFRYLEDGVSTVGSKISPIPAEPAQKSGRHNAAGKPSHHRLLELRQLLQSSVAENPPVVLHEGGMIAAGYSAELDKLRLMLSDRHQILDAYVAEEQQRVKLLKLKLKYNKIIGYYFEISKSQDQTKLPKHFIRRQSLVNGERYSTEKLAELEAMLSSADEQIVQLERRLFEELRNQVLPYVQLVLNLAQALAELDVLANFAEIAQSHNYVQPELLDSDAPFSIEEGRHPVVEQYLRNENFVPNSLKLDQEHFFALITGPNMAGKSTYLRQNALIVLMAQIGCFVPAKRARIPIVDRIFCRVGASDNLSRGESTFMIEMQETARILNEASRSSLVIMDEVGRGTSTRDGLAIAQSICEYILKKIQCKTLFATHYHELTNLSESHLKLLCLAIDESGEKIRFLKHVEEGTIACSYGVHVASLAGIPLAVTKRAEEILQRQGWQQAGDTSPPHNLFAEDTTTAKPKGPNWQHKQADELYPIEPKLESKLLSGESDRTDIDMEDSPPTEYSLSELKSLFTILVDLVEDIQQELPQSLSNLAETLQPETTTQRSRKAEELNLLFSEADLLFDDFKALVQKDPGLQQIKAKTALQTLRQWATKYFSTL